MYYILLYYVLCNFFLTLAFSPRDGRRWFPVLLVFWPVRFVDLADGAFTATHPCRLPSYAHCALSPRSSSSLVGAMHGGSVLPNTPSRPQFTPRDCEAPLPLPVHIAVTPRWGTVASCLSIGSIWIWCCAVSY